MGRRRKGFNIGDFVTCITFCRPKILVECSYEIVSYYHNSGTNETIIGVDTHETYNAWQFAEISNFEPTHIFEAKLRKEKIINLNL